MINIVSNECEVTSSWNKARTRENAGIRTMTAEQHRAVSMLALYRYKLQGQPDCFDNGNRAAVRYFEKFFVNALPIMLRTASLPTLDLAADFRDNLGWQSINNKVIKYLDYIDRRFGTWYAPMAA